MPELPEVETIVRTLTPQILEATISQTHVLNQGSLQHGDNWLPALNGHARIQAVYRRAKLVMLDVVPTPTSPLPFTILHLAFHLKMTGKFFVHPPKTVPFQHTRLTFHLHHPDGHDSTLFFDDMRKFGYCRIMTPQEREVWPFWQRLGPEPLQLSAPELAAQIARFKGGIKGALLRQDVIAGVGNIYADESLFQAQILPTAKVENLSSKRLIKLAEALQAVLRKSIEECGSSIRDYQDANGDAGSFQNYFYVYGRKNQTCKVCNSALSTASVAGRTTVYCPRCQTL